MFLEISSLFVPFAFSICLPLTNKKHAMAIKRAMILRFF